MTLHSGLILVRRLEAEPGNHARLGSGTHTARTATRSTTAPRLGAADHSRVSRLQRCCINWAPRLENRHPRARMYRRRLRGGLHEGWRATSICQFGCGGAGYPGVPRLTDRRGRCCFPSHAGPSAMSRARGSGVYSRVVTSWHGLGARPFRTVVRHRR